MNNQNKAQQETEKRPKRLALYVIYDRDGVLDGFRHYYIDELRKVTDYIVAVVSGKLNQESDEELRKIVDEVYYRDNTGLLAGAWVDGIQHVGWDTLYQYDELLMLNDSFFGPFYPIEELFDAMEESDADFYGVMKNFEEKSYTEIAGRKLKHGHFRGSICYFYIIKKNLLHSEAFKKYWSKMPKVHEDWDTYFFAEIEFYDYVLDNGFKIDAYQSDKLKGYFFDNLTHNMERNVRGNRMETLVRECSISYYGYPAPKVLLIAPAPTHPDIAAIRAGVSFGPTAYAKSCELGKLYRAIAERQHCGFIDCAELGFEINTVDGLHYSRSDHAKLAPVVTGKIREMLG